MVFGSGNRLLDKQLAEKGQARGGTLVAPQCELCWEVTEVVWYLNVRCSLVLHALSSPSLARPSGVAWTACDRYTQPVRARISCLENRPIWVQA